MSPSTVAEVRTVVLAGFRGCGIGSTLIREAEAYAAEHGVSMLIAPIFAPNTEAVSFYSRAGFGSRGVILSKKLTADSDRSVQPPP
jgi:GNAT superfamily N-acetyltransferase